MCQLVNNFSFLGVTLKKTLRIRNPDGRSEHFENNNVLSQAGDRKGRGVCLAVNTNKDKTNGKAS